VFLSIKLQFPNTPNRQRRNISISSAAFFGCVSMWVKVKSNKCGAMNEGFVFGEGIAARYVASVQCPISD
jgi:hypothetical protein